MQPRQFPSYDLYGPLREELCSLGAAAGPLLLDAFMEGGQPAQVALTMHSLASCANGSSVPMEEAWRAFRASPELNDSSVATE